MCSTGSAGERIKDSGEPMEINGDSRHHIGSVSKSMTATLLAILMEEDVIESWNTTLPEVLPEAMGSAYENVTLKELVGMLSGLDNSPPDWGMYELETSDLREQRRLATIDALQSTPLHTPGTAYLSSNWAYVVAGHIIEDLTGLLWEEALVTMLFEPLGISLPADPISSVVGAPDNANDPWGHIGEEREPCNPSTNELNCDNEPIIGPAGTFSGPVAAMAKYFAFHLACHKGEHPLLSEESCKTLHQPADASINPYGYGWVCMQRQWAGMEDGLACTHAGSNTINLYVVWFVFGVERACVTYTNQFASVSDFNMTDQAIGALILGQDDEQRDGPISSSSVSSLLLMSRLLFWIQRHPSLQQVHPKQHQVPTPPSALTP